FEQEIKYPITQVGTSYFRNVNLSDYDVLVVPEGYYRILDEAMLERISAWVADGGRLILIGSALNSFAEKKGFGLKRYATDQEKNQAERLEEAQSIENRLARYADAERKGISETISGAIYKVRLDNSHPLGFGLNDHYFTLKTSELRFAFLEDGWNVGVIQGQAKPIMGFAGYRANARMHNSLVFGVENKGRGQVVYLVDNPHFRNLWQNRKMLFANVVFMVGQ